MVRLTAVALTLTIGVILAEVSLRIFRLAPATGVSTVTQREFEEVPGILLPRQRLVDRRNRHLPHEVSINSLGYRGLEIASNPATVPYRLLVLGDSFTYGDFVDDHQTLPAALQRVLSTVCPGVEVVNAGVPGSGIAAHSAMFERALELQIDHVILVFTANDVTDLIPPTPWDRLAANRRAKSSFPMSVVYPVARRTALWNLGLQVRGKLQARQGRRAMEEEADSEGVEPRVSLIREAESAGGRHDALREKYSDLLMALFERTQDLEIPFLFVVYPSHHSLSGTALEDERWVYEDAKRAGIPALNLRKSLLETELPVDSLYLLPLDGHPSPGGYAAAADALAEVIVAGRDEAWRSCAKEG